MRRTVPYPREGPSGAYNTGDHPAQASIKNTHKRRILYKTLHRADHCGGRGVRLIHMAGEARSALHSHWHQV